MAMLLSPGSMIRGYTITGAGRGGGQATVYPARRGTDKCALRQHHASFGPGSPDDKRFERIKRFIGCRSPYVAELFDAFIHDGLPYTVWEWVEGKTLEDLVGSGSALNPDLFHTVAHDVLMGLAWLHEDLKVLHRDLKPGNIILCEDGGRQHAKIIDLGNVLHLGLSRVTTDGKGIVTLAFAPPEQFAGEAEVEASDIYSFAVTLFNAMTGISPFERRTEAETLAAILAPKRPSLRDYIPEVWPELDDYLQRLMAPLPEDRPDSAREVWTQLDGLLKRHLDVTATSRVPRSAAIGLPGTAIAATIPSAIETIAVASQIHIVDGPLAGSVLALTNDALTVGRMTINPEDKCISRFHCRVIRKEKGFLLRDISSSNGLLHRNRRVRHALLKPGESIVIGNTELACK